MVKLHAPRPLPDAGPDSLPHPPPRWGTGHAMQASEETWFFAGAALAALDSVANGLRPAVPRPLLADRLALAAAEASLRMQGRPPRRRASVTAGRGAGPAFRTSAAAWP